MPICVEVETVTQDTKIQAVQTALEMKKRNKLAWKASLHSLHGQHPPLRHKLQCVSQPLQKGSSRHPESRICSVPQI